MYTKDELRFIRKNSYLIKKFIEEFEITKEEWINKFYELNPDINECKLEKYFNDEFYSFIHKIDKYTPKYNYEKILEIRPFADIFDLYCEKIDYGYPDPEDLGETR